MRRVELETIKAPEEFKCCECEFYIKSYILWHDTPKGRTFRTCKKCFAEMNKLVGEVDAAKLMEVSVSWLQSNRAKNDEDTIPHMRIGNRIKYNGKKLGAYIADLRLKLQEANLPQPNREEPS